MSAGAGFPVWQDLLDELAIQAGFTEAELPELRKVDLRDQAALLSKRLLAKGQALGELISSRFRPTGTPSFMDSWPPSTCAST